MSLRSSKDIEGTSVLLSPTVSFPSRDVFFEGLFSLSQASVLFPKFFFKNFLRTQSLDFPRSSDSLRLRAPGRFLRSGRNTPSLSLLMPLSFPPRRATMPQHCPSGLIQCFEHVGAAPYKLHCFFFVFSLRLRPAPPSPPPASASLVFLPRISSQGS